MSLYQRTQDLKPPILDRDEPPLGESAMADLYEWLVAGEIPGTLMILDDGRAVVETMPAFFPLLEHLGDQSPTRASVWIVDPLPRARLFASKPPFEFFGLPDDCRARWRFNTRRLPHRKSPRTPAPLPRVSPRRERQLVSREELFAAIPDAAQLTRDQIVARIAELFPHVKGSSLQCNYFRVMSAIKNQEK